MRLVLVSSLDLRSWHDADRNDVELNAPLGVLSLAAVARDAGHEVVVLDPNAEIARKTLQPGPGFAAAAAARVAALRPQVLGVSTMCNSYHIGLRLAEACRERMPELPIVFGGPHASVVDVATLTHFPFIDYILRGEAELTLPGFLQELTARGSATTTPGLTYRGEDRIVRNPDPALLPDLDELPMPAYDLLPYSPAASGAIDAGRGCPFRCTFCSTSTYWRRTFRLKSIARILAEMRHLQERFGATVFSFQHDLFTFRKDRVREFCRALRAEGWQVRWSCSARVDTVDEALLSEMAEAGCCGIFYGVETASPRLQREIKKRLNLNRVLPILRATAAQGIAPTASFICGFPGETAGDLQQTFAMIQDLLLEPRVSVQLHLLGPEPGAPDYALHRNRLRYDGYFSDIAGTAYSMTEPDWFQQHPDIFSSFHYYETDGLPRDLVKGADLFVHGICSPLRRALPALMGGPGGLWRLYRAWKTWCAGTGRGGGPGVAQPLDEFLMDFHSFVESEIVAGALDASATGAVTDAILEFYLRNYGDTPVREIAPGQPIPGVPEEDPEPVHS